MASKYSLIEYDPEDERINDPDGPPRDNLEDIKLLLDNFADDVAAVRSQLDMNDIEYLWI
jgi:hypothetical protein